MNKCEFCYEDHDGSYGSGRFCGSKCSHRFGQSINQEERNRKISETTKANYNNPDFGPNKEENKKALKETFARIRLENALYRQICDFNELPPSRHRERVIFEQNNECNHCHRSVWLEQQIPLQLEHKDGNNKNNTRDNLEAICANCHSFTPTWRKKK